MKGMNLKSKGEFWWWRFLGKFNGPILTRFWTTIGSTIYYPTTVQDPEQWETILEHEAVHVEQYRKYTVPLFLILYLLVPLPFGLAFFRWKFEREAYLVDVKSGRMTPEQVAHTMWRDYGFAWPKPLMLRWFRKKGF